MTRVRAGRGRAGGRGRGREADKLLLQDSSCAGTIRKATFEDDHDFIGQLTKASEYQPKLSRRDVLQVYYFINPAPPRRVGCFGVLLPTLNELWSTLDSHRREYDSLSAFEKDFQRRRQDFTAILLAIFESSFSHASLFRFLRRFLFDELLQVESNRAASWSLWA